MAIFKFSAPKKNHYSDFCVKFIYCFHSYLTQYADSDNINYTLYYQFFKGIAMVPFKWADSSCLEKKQKWWPRTQTVITKERATPRRWSKEQKDVSQTMRWFSINNDMLIRYGWWAISRMHLLIKISFQFVFLRYEKNKESKLLETYKKLPWRNGDVLRVAKKKNNTRTCAHTRHYLTSYYELDIGKMIPCIIIAV